LFLGNRFCSEQGCTVHMTHRRKKTSIPWWKEGNARKEGLLGGVNRRWRPARTAAKARDQKNNFEEERRKKNSKFVKRRQNGRVRNRIKQTDRINPWIIRRKRGSGRPITEGNAGFAKGLTLARRTYRKKRTRGPELKVYGGGEGRNTNEKKETGIGG